VTRSTPPDAALSRTRTRTDERGRKIKATSSRSKVCRHGRPPAIATHTPQGRVRRAPARYGADGARPQAHSHGHIGPAGGDELRTPVALETTACDAEHDAMVEEVSSPPPRLPRGATRRQ
jgi:hypothetical protein